MIRSYIIRVIKLTRDDDNYQDCENRNEFERFFSNDCSRYGDQAYDGLAAVTKDILESNDKNKVVFTRADRLYYSEHKTASSIEGGSMNAFDPTYLLLGNLFEIIINAQSSIIHTQLTNLFDHERRPQAEKIHKRLVTLMKEITGEIPPEPKEPEY